MHKIIQIYPCLLKLSRKQESVTGGQTDRRMDGQTAAITISLTAIAGGQKILHWLPLNLLSQKASGQISLKNIGRKFQKDSKEKNYQHLYLVVTTNRATKCLTGLNLI